MIQIGFKNFRRFIELKPLDLNPITIFVGENNAGKSTVVKAMLSVLDFIKTRVSSLEGDSWTNLNFYFNKSYYTHIGTFARAHYNKADESEPITFTMAVGDRIYEFDVEKSDSESDVFGRVSRFKITIVPYNIDITYSLRINQPMIIVFHSKPHPLFDLESYRSSEDPFRSPSNYFKGLKQDIVIETSIVPGISFSSDYIADALLYSFHERITATISSLISNTTTPKANAILGLPKESYSFLLRKRAYLLSKRFRNAKQKEMDIEYIYAHAVTQTILFSAKDTNDYHVKTVHEFANLQVGPGSPAKDFIIKWMKEFKIGQDYDIDSVGGEAHLVRILNLDGEYVNLADMGMGSIQLMILLFRVATKMAEAGIGFGKKTVNSLLIVEEPEQNLHPMLQSKLTDLFLCLNHDYGFRFVIETHSEYLIRKTQVYLAREHYNSQSEMQRKTPFKVVYFPCDGKQPYYMNYRLDGKFSNDFGPGFFDEASNLVFDIL